MGPQQFDPIEAIERALDVAAQVARDELEDPAAIERVRTFVHRQLAGEPAQLSLDDLAYAVVMLCAASAPPPERDDF